MEAIPRHFVAEDWITITFMSILIILAVVRTIYPVEFYNFSRIFISNKFFIERYNSNRLFGAFSYALVLVQTLVFSFGIYFIIDRLNFINDSSYRVYLQIVLMYLVFMGGKFFLEKIVGALFSIQEFLNRYLFFKTTYKNFLALILLPLLLVLSYIWGGGPNFLKGVFVVFLLANLLVLGVFYRRTQEKIITHLFYFILYLCIFEIAPYFIMYKLIAHY